MTSPSSHKSCKSCNCAVPFKFVWNMTKVWAITQYWIATCWICPKTWNVMEKNAAEMIKDNFVAWIKLCHKVFPIHTLSYRLGIYPPLPPHNKDKFTTYWCEVKVELTFTMFLQKKKPGEILRSGYSCQKFLAKLRKAHWETSTQRLTLSDLWFIFHTSREGNRLTKVNFVHV